MKNSVLAAARAGQSDGGLRCDARSDVSGKPRRRNPLAPALIRDASSARPGARSFRRDVAQRVEKPGDAGVHQRDPRCDGADAKVRKRERRLDPDHAEAPRVAQREAARQRGEKIGLGKHGQRHHEVRHRERDAPRAALLRQCAVDETEGVAGQRNDGWRMAQNPLIVGRAAKGCPARTAMTKSSS